MSSRHTFYLSGITPAIGICFWVCLVVFLAIFIHLAKRCFITVSSWKHSLPFKSELVHGEDEGSDQIFSPSSSLHTLHRDICITFCVASVALWWVGGPAQWRIWQAKCEIKQQMRPCSLTSLMEADQECERRETGSCDCHERYLGQK